MPIDPRRLTPVGSPDNKILGISIVVPARLQPSPPLEAALTYCPRAEQPAAHAGARASGNWQQRINMFDASFSIAFLFLVNASRVFLMQIVAGFGSAAVAKYTIAVRIIIFLILPVWGLSNDSATLVRQNLGAGLADRAETTVWLFARYVSLLYGRDEGFGAAVHPPHRPVVHHRAGGG